jgi:hypothetical protein
LLTREARFVKKEEARCSVCGGDPYPGISCEDIFVCDNCREHAKSLGMTDDQTIRRLMRERGYTDEDGEIVKRALTRH